LEYVIPILDTAFDYTVKGFHTVYYEVMTHCFMGITARKTKQATVPSLAEILQKQQVKETDAVDNDDDTLTESDWDSDSQSEFITPLPTLNTTYETELSAISVALASQTKIESAQVAEGAQLESAQCEGAEGALESAQVAEGAEGAQLESAQCEGAEGKTEL